MKNSLHWKIFAAYTLRRWRYCKKIFVIFGLFCENPSEIAIRFKINKNKEAVLNDGRSSYSRDRSDANSRFCDKCHAMSQYDLNEPVWNNGASAKRNLNVPNEKHLGCTDKEY